MRQALILVGAAIALIGAGHAPKPKAPYSAIYCLRGPHNDFRYFAAKEQPDGRLLFGVSHWHPNGAASGTYGLAQREGDHWTYTEPRDEFDRSAPYPSCTVRIWLGRDGVPRVEPDKVARCPGGYHEELGTISFPRRAYYRPVTRELDDAEAFEAASVCGNFSG